MKHKRRVAMREKIKETMSPEFMEALKAQGCYMCSNIHTPEYVKSMQYRQDHNLWDNLDEVHAILKDKSWSWAKNTDCKYLDIRVDTRDGGCLIVANSSAHQKPRRISPKQLRWQYSEATPDPVPDSEAYGE